MLGHVPFNLCEVHELSRVALYIRQQALFTLIQRNPAHQVPYDPDTIRQMVQMIQVHLPHRAARLVRDMLTSTGPTEVTILFMIGLTTRACLLWQFRSLEHPLKDGQDSVRRAFCHTPFHLVERLFPQPTYVRASQIGTENGLWNDSEEIIAAFARVAILAWGAELTERPMGQMYFKKDSRGSHPSTIQQWQHSPADSVGWWHGAAANHLDDSVFFNQVCSHQRQSSTWHYRWL